MPVTVSTLTRHRGPFPDPYDYVLPGGLTVKYFGYSRPNAIALQELNLCYERAVQTAYIKVNHGQGEIPVGTNPQSWSSGNIYLRIEPGQQMTWRDWSEALISIRLFVYTNELKGTQFLIQKDGHGQIGTGSILREPEAKYVPTNTSVTALPTPIPDPYNLRLQGLTVEFYGYGGRVSPFGLEECVVAAYQDVQRHVSSHETTMTAPSYSYSDEGVNLYLRPEGGRLTWDIWFDVPLRIQGFVMKNKFREMQFILKSDEFGRIGSGRLVNVAGASIDTA